MKSYTITVEVNSQHNENPLDASKKALELIKQNGHSFIYYVEDEETKIKYMVDLQNETVVIENE